MNIDAFTEILHEFGIKGLLAVLAVMLMYYFIRKKDKKNEDRMAKEFSKLSTTITEQNRTLGESMIKQNAQLIEAISKTNEYTQERLFELIREDRDNREIRQKSRHSLSLNKRHEASEAIDQILFEIMNYTHAQRVTMLEFHNSKENIDGLAFMWYDVQNEKQERGVTPLSPHYRNLQATNIRPIINRVNNDPRHIIHLTAADIEEIYNESTVLYYQLKERHLEHVIYCGVYNTRTQELIGLITIEYQEGHKFNEDFIDIMSLKEHTVLIEHIYNNARIFIEKHKDDYEAIDAEFRRT